MQHQTPDPRPNLPEAPAPDGRYLPRRERESPPSEEPSAGFGPHVEQILPRALDRAPLAISVLDGSELAILLANSAFTLMVGGRALRGRPVREALPELAGQGIVELFDRVRETGEPFRGREMTLAFDRTGSGVPEPGVFDLLLEPLGGDEGGAEAVLCYATDVTRHVRAREDLMGARAAAERANDAKTGFLASMSHDLRTPLTAIGGYASLVAEGVEGPVTAGQADAMGRIARANAHLLALIDDVLRFAKIEAGSLPMEIEVLPLGELITDLGELMEPQVSEKGLEYECAEIADDLRVLADRDRLTQVLLNLLTNALKFTDAGTLTVECEETDAQVFIRVRDTGRGIPPEMIGRIFDPFIQVAAAGDRSGGVGLGLATSLSLARGMHGDLTVESELGHGSTFTLVLPRA